MSFFADLIELLLPERCAGCGVVPVLLCDGCAAPLRGPARPARTAPAGLPPPWTVTTYEGPLRAILSAYKEHGRTALATPLGEALATSVHAALKTLPSTLTPAPARAAGGGRLAEQRGVVLVWVPSGRGAVHRRGHDPMRATVAVALRRLRAGGLPVTAVDALRQRGRVVDQAGLTAAQRAANLDGALEVTKGNGLAGRQVILVDDVTTTGASLAEAARALRAAGADVAAVATIAATPRHRPP